MNGQEIKDFMSNSNSNAQNLSDNVHVFVDYDEVSREVAAHIAALIRQKPNAVLGLATGSTPIGVYAELVRLHREESLDFSRVSCFNLDEYYPMLPDAPQSYHRFMREHLFDHINCDHWHVPDGAPREISDVETYCTEYERMIAAAGGLDLQLLGIGRTGHIGFNEPGSPQDSPTRLVVLDSLTRADAADDFFGVDNVPVRAITMGVGTILSAREIIIMASGARKAAIVHEAFEGKITSKVPASFLREHANAQWFLDEGAASQLTAFAQPWRAATDFSSAELRRRALIDASQQLDKPLAKLAANDLQQIGLGALTHQVISLEAAVQEVERDLQNRLDDAMHLPHHARVLCLSPHPDDDVICCGATLIKMARSEGNEVHVAYGVSGSNAVRDKDVLALLRAQHPRLISYLEDNAPPGKSVQDVFEQIRMEIFERESGAPDSVLLRNLKRLIREGEAADACRKMGAKPIFWDLPFYYERESNAAPVGDNDAQIALATLRAVRPDVVMMTGEKSDPHGTHELCAQAFERAAEIYLQEGGAAFARWHYRGAWDEYTVEQGDYFSVFEKELMEQKVGLILDHISQLDPVFPGSTDAREFYERARDRNRANARQLQALGVLPPSRSFAPVYAEVFQIEK
jgi:glucosamine-6-phosphate deaminase